MIPAHAGTRRDSISGFLPRVIWHCGANAGAVGHSWHAAGSIQTDGSAAIHKISPSSFPRLRRLMPRRYSHHAAAVRLLPFFWA
jgi:hypothetical protein